MPARAGFESLGAFRQTRQRRSPAAQSVVESPSELPFRHESRAIDESPLERRARDVVSRDDILVPDARCVERDAANFGSARAIHGDLVSILRTRLELPEACRGRVGRDRPVYGEDDGE
jgi:hypothetical protein